MAPIKYGSSVLSIAIRHLVAMIDKISKLEEYQDMNYLNRLDTERLDLALSHLWKALAIIDKFDAEHLYRSRNDLVQNKKGGYDGRE